MKRLLDRMRNNRREFFNGRKEFKYFNILGLVIRTKYLNKKTALFDVVNYRCYGEL